MNPIKITVNENNINTLSKSFDDLFVGKIIVTEIQNTHPYRKIKCDVICDGCGKIVNIYVNSYYIHTKNNGEYLCSECAKKRKEEHLLKLYGVTNVTYIPEVREKARNTNLERYGYVTPSKNEEVASKRRATNIEKYGVECTLSNEEIRQKRDKTCIEKYGTANVLSNKEIFAKALEKRLKNESGIFSDGVPTSKQQLHFYDLFGGELNKLINGYFVDIMLSNSIFFEYNGGGHDLSVKLGNLTQEQFNNREQERDGVLFGLGLKKFCIESCTDILDSDGILLDLKNKAEEVLLNTSSVCFCYNMDTKETKIY